MNIINIFKRYIFRIVFLPTFVIVMGEPSFSMEPEDDFTKIKIQNSNKTFCATRARDRLNFAKKCLELNPEMTITTKIRNGDKPGPTLFSIYEGDKEFILENTKNRENSEKIKEQMEELDQLIKKESWDKEISFSDYNFIGYVWAIILTPVVIDCWKISEIFQLYQDCLTDKAKIFSTDLDFCKPFVFISSEGLSIPHISVTGAVPIPTINDACGFFVGKDNKKVSYIDFLAVGTNEKLKVDFDTDVSALFSWEHDLGHAKSGQKIRSKLDQQINPLKYAYKIAIFREYVLEQLKNAVEEQKLFELAFFSIFHENEPTTVFDNLSMPIKNYLRAINRVKEKYISNKDQAIHHILNTWGEDTHTQYQTEIAGAKWLKIEIKGDTCAEQVQDYLGKLILGLNILEKYSNIYNEAKV